MAAGPVFLILLQFGFAACTEDLHLLALVPLENMAKETGNCLDMGEELIPAAEIAAARINNNSELLADFNLRIIPAGTDQCSDPSIAKALASFTGFTTNRTLSVVGLIGLVCPAPLLRLSTLASHPEIDIVHITSSTTPPSIADNSRTSGIGRLFQIAPASTVFNDVVIALMEKHSWTNISVIRRADSISIEHDHIASDFQVKVGQLGGKLSIDMYSEAASGLEQFVQAVKASGVRIIYVSVTVLEARELLCLSYRNDVLWPNYVWIFHDFSVENLLSNISDCSVEDMRKALEGIIILHHQVNSDSSREIDFLDYTYGEYYTQYSERLQNISPQPVCNKEAEILSANALHDSVIAFAYALNKSLSSDFSCLRRLGVVNCTATQEVVNNLVQVNFSGASGEVSFNETTHELTVASKVNISQVFDGSLILLAQYDGAITEKGNQSLSVVHNTFERMIIRLSLALPLSTLVVVGLCLAVTLITFILFVIYRDSVEIKATSPLLSYIILFACILLYTSAGITAVRHGFASGQIYANLCASEQFFFALGVQVIFATLFVRLLRVFRIFFNLDPIGTAWSDKYLALYVTIIVLVTLFLSLLWLGIEDFDAGEREEFIADSSPPYFAVYLSCDAQYQSIFLSLIWGYTALVMILVIILAIKTRKVSIDIFKDTKSVNAFVFCSVGIFALFTPLSYITASFTSMAAMILSYLFQVVSIIIVSVACICLLFLPKIYLALFGPGPSKPRSKSVSSAGRSRDSGGKTVAMKLSA